MKNNPEKITINEGGPKEVLKIAFPLILSTSAMTLQMFVDRVFLMWYDRDAMSAAFQGGILSFVFFSFFIRGARRKGRARPKTRPAHLTANTE